MPEPAHQVGDLRRLAWLADAPFFIDRQQVEAFYDAVIRPESKEKSITLSLKSLESHKTTLGGELEAEVSVAEWLTKILPFLDASVKGKGSAGRETEREKEEGRTVEFEPISNPQRQLVQLTFHYLLHLPTRFRIVSDPGDPSWYTPAFIEALPRALVFIDFPPRTCYAPMALELSNGDVITTYEHLATAFSGPGGEKNPNPEPALGDQQGWDRYWRWFSEHFHAHRATETVEKAAGEGKSRIRWIDYRVPLTVKGEYTNKTAHLHVCGRGDHDTGVFAYNLIQRGWRWGLRMVGTLKSAPDINVLAIFDK
jgi:hypothetical protein